MRFDMPADRRVDYMAYGLWTRLRYLWKHNRKKSIDDKEIVNYFENIKPSSICSLYPNIGLLVNRNWL